MGINNSDCTSEQIKNLDEKGLLQKTINFIEKYKLAITFTIWSALTACWGGGWWSVNQAPTVWNPNISISVPEGTTWTGNLNDSLPSDPNWDAFTFNIVWTAPAGFTYNKNTWAYSYAAPLVTGNQTKHILFNVTDVKWASSLINIDLAATSIDWPYDAPLTVSAITWPKNVWMLNDSIFTVNANDLDGIQSALFSIVDTNGVEVVSDANLKSNTIITPTINGNKYDITLKAGLINTAWVYTLKTSFVWVTVWQNPSSQIKIVSKTFNVLKDVAATATPSGFTSTTSSISWNITVTDPDGLTSSWYIITLATQTTAPTTGYTPFTNNNPAWWALNFTWLNSWTSYKVWTQITSLNASTNLNTTVVIPNTFSTLQLDTVPPTMSAPSYSITTPTNWNVVVTITTTEVNIWATPAGWTRTWTAWAYNFTKTYTTNLTETVTFSDTAWNTTPVNVSVANIDKIAPTQMVFSWVTPDTQNTQYNALALSLNDSVIGGTITSLTSSAWWTLSTPTIDGAWNVVFNFLTPTAAGTTLTLTWADAAWNAFTITLNVSLPLTVNTAPTIWTPVVIWDLFIWPLTSITVPITDDNLALVTWSLSFISPSWVETWTFSQTTWTWDTLRWISFNPQFTWSGRTIQATIVDSWAWTTNTTTVYSN